MKQQTSQKKRSTYFIKKTFQTKFIVRFILLLIAGGIISGALLYLLASSELETNLFSAHLEIRNTWDILSRSILITQITVIVLISIGTIYTVLYISHKIAGPLYRFEKIATEIGEGNLDIYLTLRTGDELKPLESAFKVMVGNLKNRIIEFKKGYDNIKNLENDIKNAILTSNLSEDEKQTLDKALTEWIEQYEQNLNTFILPEK